VCLSADGWSAIKEEGRIIAGGTEGKEALTFDVGNGVQYPARSQDVCILGQQCRPVTQPQLYSHERIGVTYVMILAFCFLNLKCGSGNKKNIFVNCPPCHQHLIQFRRVFLHPLDHARRSLAYVSSSSHGSPRRSCIRLGPYPVSRRGGAIGIGGRRRFGRIRRP